MPPKHRMGPPTDGEGGSSVVRKILSFIVVCSCVACFVGCLFLIDDLIKNPSKDDKGRHIKQKSTIEIVVGVTTYAFYMLLSLVLFLVEWEPLWVFNYALILHYWPGRGIFHLFLGSQLIHSASVMNAVDVFGLDGDKVKTAIQIFGWTFFGTGSVFILLGVCQMRGADGNDVVKKVRKGGSYYQAQKLPPSKTASGQVSLLYKLKSEGVMHLDDAISELENLMAEEEAESGISGWFKKKFGKEKKGQQKPAELTGVATHKTDGTEYETIQPAQVASAPPPPERPGYGTDPNPISRGSAATGGYGDADDDIKARRQREDEELEREYMRRQQMYQ